MSNKAIRAALLAHLIAMPGGVTLARTQTQNDAGFDPPADGLYQRARLMPATPFNYGGTSAYKRFQGYFQISVCAPGGEGTGDGDDYADLVQAWFKQGLQVTANGVNTNVGKTPDIRPGRIEGDVWVIPIRVPYFANVSN